MWIVPYDPFLIKKLIKNEICGSMNSVWMHCSQKTGQKLWLRYIDSNCLWGKRVKKKKKKEKRRNATQQNATLYLNITLVPTYFWKYKWELISHGLTVLSLFLSLQPNLLYYSLITHKFEGVGCRVKTHWGQCRRQHRWFNRLTVLSLFLSLLAPNSGLKIDVIDSQSSHYNLFLSLFARNWGLKIDVTDSLSSHYFFPSCYITVSRYLFPSSHAIWGWDLM